MSKAKIIRRILLVLLSLLLISGAVLFIYAVNNTASIVNAVIEHMRGEDSPWRFSFEEIETGNEEGILLTGFSLYYDDNFIARLDSITLDAGLGEMWNFWKNEGSSLSLKVKGGRVDLTAMLSAYEDYDRGEVKGSFSFYDFITTRNTSVSGENIVIEYDYLKGTADTIFLSYDSCGSLLTGSFTSSSIGVFLSPYKGNLITAECFFTREEEITVSVAADRLDLAGNDMELKLSSLSFTESTPSLKAFIQNDFLATLYIEEGEVTTEEAIASFSDTDISYSDTTMNLSFGRTEAESGSYTVSTDSFLVSLDTDTSYNASSDGFLVTDKSMSTTFSDVTVKGKMDEKRGDVSVESISGEIPLPLSGSLASFSLSSLDASYVFDDTLSATFTLPLLNAEAPSIPLEIDAETITGKLEDGKLTFSSDSVSTDFSSLTSGKITDVRLSSFSASFTYKDDVSLGFSFSASATPSGGKIGNITFSSLGKISFDDEDGKEWRIEIDDLYPGFGSVIRAPLVALTGEDGETLITLTSDSITTDLALDTDERQITGSVTVTDLPLKSALEFLLGREVEKISEKSSINLTSDISVSRDEDGKTEGRIDFDLTITAFRFTFFDIAVSADGSLVIKDGIITLDGVVLNTPLGSFPMEGYYDTVTGEPHFSFTK